MAQTPHAFKDIVMEYSDVLNEQKRMRKRASELKAEVLGYMREHIIDEVSLRDGSKLVRKRTKKTEGLKKEHIAGELRKIVGSDVAADEAVENMLARRAIGESETLALVKASSHKDQEA